MFSFSSILLSIQLLNSAQAGFGLGNPPLLPEQHGESRSAAEQRTSADADPFALFDLAWEELVSWLYRLNASLAQDNVDDQPAQQLWPE